jgi:hypothetical protein
MKPDNLRAIVESKVGYISDTLWHDALSEAKHIIQGKSVDIHYVADVLEEIIRKMWRV